MGTVIIRYVVKKVLTMITARHPSESWNPLALREEVGFQLSLE